MPGSSLSLTRFRKEAQQAAIAAFSRFSALVAVVPASRAGFNNGFAPFALSSAPFPNHVLAPLVDGGGAAPFTVVPPFKCAPIDRAFPSFSPALGFNAAVTLTPLSPPRSVHHGLHAAYGAQAGYAAMKSTSAFYANAASLVAKKEGEMRALWRDLLKEYARQCVPPPKPGDPPCPRAEQAALERDAHARAEAAMKAAVRPSVVCASPFERVASRDVFRASLAHLAASSPPPSDAAAAAAEVVGRWDVTTLIGTRRNATESARNRAAATALESLLRAVLAPMLRRAAQQRALRCMPGESRAALAAKITPAYRALLRKSLDAQLVGLFDANEAAQVRSLRDTVVALAGALGASVRSQSVLDRFHSPPFARYNAHRSMWLSRDAKSASPEATLLGASMLLGGADNVFVSAAAAAAAAAVPGFFTRGGRGESTHAELGRTLDTAVRGCMRSALGDGAFASKLVVVSQQLARADLAEALDAVRATIREDLSAPALGRVASASLRAILLHRLPSVAPPPPRKCFSRNAERAGALAAAAQRDIAPDLAAALRRYLRDLLDWDAGNKKKLVNAVVWLVDEAFKRLAAGGEPDGGRWCALERRLAHVAAPLLRPEPRLRLEACGFGCERERDDALLEFERLSQSDQPHSPAAPAASPPEDATHVGDRRGGAVRAVRAALGRATAAEEGPHPQPRCGCGVDLPINHREKCGECDGSGAGKRRKL